MYRAIGFAHATVHHKLQRAHRVLAAREEGQGTVEYIGLILWVVWVGLKAAGVVDEFLGGGWAAGVLEEPHGQADVALQDPQRRREILGEVDQARG